LDASGVEMIDPCGEIFNPNAMEAMVTVPTDLPEEDGQVCEVFQKGYRLGDQLLRVAQVSVLKER
jgi:molecular chaperone GrpE